MKTHKASDDRNTHDAAARPAAPPAVMDADVIILGGGPAGLGAAYRAARAGHAVVLLERSERVGGAAGSFTVAGQRVDHGSHRLHPSTDPRIVGDLSALLGDDLQRRTRNGRIRLADRWIAFPLKTGDLVRRLPPAFAAAAIRDTLTAPLRSSRADTFAEVVRAGLGPTMGKRFYYPYARKVWGVDPSELSGEQARRRVGANTPGKLLRRVVTARADDKGWFWYPRGGFGAISERLADAAARHGADVRLSTPASRVDVLPDRVRVEADGGTLEAERVWSTLPVTVLSRIVRPNPPAAVTRAAQALSFRAMLLVYLVLPVDRYTRFDAHYLPGADTPVTRISEPKNYRDGDDPAGQTVLCAEIPCNVGDERWSAGENALGALVVGTLAHVGLPAARPSDVVVRRLSHAYPIYRSGYERHFAALDAWAGGLERVLTFGRQGLFAHDNTHHALAMAYDAVSALGRDGTWDAGAWAAARARFADHVVED